MPAPDVLQPTKWIVMAVALIAATTAYAGADKSAKESRKQLEAQLREYYKMQPRRKFFDPRKMLGVEGQTPSVILVTQQRGISIKFPMEDGGYTSAPVTTVEGGKIAGASSGRFLGMTAAETRPLRLGELVYLTDLNVDEGCIRLDLRTVEAETWAFRKAMLVGSLSFPMEPQAITNLSPDAFLAMARPFLLTEEEAAKLPPPTVSLGQTPDEVTAILGQPKRVVNLGGKEIYAYADMKIIFVNGKVSDVQ
jgi:hypothetical protein